MEESTAEATGEESAGEERESGSEGERGGDRGSWAWAEYLRERSAEQRCTKRRGVSTKVPPRQEYWNGGSTYQEVTEPNYRKRDRES